MKLKKEYTVYHSENKSILIPVEDTEFSGIVKGNKTFGIILDCLQKGTTEKNIVKYLKEKYRNADIIAENDVKKVLAELRKIGAIDEYE